jgi:hypothetical protein
MSVRKIKSFTPKKKEAREPIRFKVLEEEFEAVPAIPGITLLEFVSAGASSDDEEEGGGNAGSAKGILNYLKASMKKSEYKRFHAFVSDPENEIEIDTLSEIVAHLIESQASRPTEAS